MSNDVPLLTAKDADYWESNDWNPWDKKAIRIVRKMRAIAEGRAVVVPRMTEAEAMAMCAHNAGSADDYAINLDGYLAALRDIGAIRD